VYYFQPRRTWCFRYVCGAFVHLQNNSESYGRVLAKFSRPIDLCLWSKINRLDFELPLRRGEGFVWLIRATKLGVVIHLEKSRFLGGWTHPNSRQPKFLEIPFVHSDRLTYSDSIWCGNPCWEWFYGVNHTPTEPHRRGPRNKIFGNHCVCSHPLL